MAQGDKGRVELNLKASLCTENPTGTDIYRPGDPEAKHVENTGIERQGGLTTAYENLVNLLGSYPDVGIVTADGRTLVTSADNVFLNNRDILVNSSYASSLNLGNVGPLTVYRRGSLPGFADAAWTADDTVIAISISGTKITVYELMWSAIGSASPLLITNSRDITFAGMVTANLKSVSLIRYVDMHYVDNQEFYVRYFNTTEDQILKESGTSITKVATNTVDYANFAHRLGANRYVWGEQGKVASWQMGDILFGGGGYTAHADAKWCVIDRWRGLADSRAVYTFDVYKNAANTLTGMATAGYDGAGAYSAVLSYKGLALAAVVATVTNKINGPGWSEATYTRNDTGTNIYSYIATKLTHNAAAYYDVVQTQTQTPMNGYGKLTDLDGNHTFTVNWKVLLTNGSPTTLAAATIEAGTTNDNLGVPITGVGEFDPYYTACVFDTAVYSDIIYRFNGVLFFVDVRSGVGHSWEKISNTLYQVNTLSPINLVDTVTQTLNLGINDYNGRLRWSSVGAITTTSRMSSVLSGTYSNSIDVGEKLTTQTIASGIGIPYGIAAPAYWIGPLPYSIKIFSNGLYFQSAVVQGSFFTDALLAGLLYVVDTRLPIAMGYAYRNQCALTDQYTIFTGVGVLGSPDVDFSYAGYELGNVAGGRLDSFSLFGERFVFDGFNVYRADFTGSAFTGKTFIAPAIGLTFVASSPKAAYFLSTFDYSLYAFDGGRALTKIQRFSKFPFFYGAYSTRDESLVLDTSGYLMWIRDGVISRFPKSTTNWTTAGTPVTTIGLSSYQLRFFDTQKGLMIYAFSASQPGGEWQYTFEQPPALLPPTGLPYPIPVPFVFKSAYFGLKAEVQMAATAFDVTLYSPSKAAAAVTLTCDFIDVDGTHTQTQYQNIMPSDWSSLGLFRCRIRPGSGDPATNKVIAASIGVKFTTKLVLTGISMEWIEDVPAVPAAQRSV